MSKRFTDSAKWDDPWFSDLPNDVKLAWIFLCDKCDIAGFWKKSQRHLSFAIGSSASLEYVFEHLQGRAVNVGEKWFIPSFVKFQNGVLKETNNCHLSIISILSSNGYDKNFEPLMSSSGAPHEGPCKSNSKSNSIKESLDSENTTREPGSLLKLISQIVANGPDAWRAEEIQATMMWREWAKELPDKYRDQLPEIAAKYKAWADDRFHKKKIGPLSLQSFIQKKAYAVIYEIEKPPVDDWQNVELAF